MITQNTTISVSTWSIVKIFLIIIGFWFLYQIREILLILFVAILLASILERPVSYLQSKKIPRALSVILIYLIMISLLLFLALSLIPPLTEQINQLAVTFPSYLERFLNLFKTSSQTLANLRNSLETLAANLAQGTTNNLLNTVFSFFGGFVSIIIIFVLTFYLIVQEDALKRFIRAIVPDRYQPYLNQLFGKIQTKLGDWLRGQLTLGLIIAILVYIGLTILGVPYALVLAPLAGLFEFVPYVGPISAAIPAVVIALAISPLKAILVVALYILIQQLENHVLVPKVMQKAVGLNPLVSILAVLVGVKLGGVLGALISIPVAAALSVLTKDFYQEVKGK